MLTTGAAVVASDCLLTCSVVPVEAVAAAAFAVAAPDCKVVSASCGI